jgi:hypothetical protein
VTTALDNYVFKVYISASAYLNLLIVVSGKAFYIFLAFFLFVFCIFELIFEMLTVKFHFTAALNLLTFTLAFFLNLSSHFCNWDSYPF